MGDEPQSESTPRTQGVPLEVIPLHSATLLTALDETGIIQYESPSIEDIHGFGQEELIGEQVADYFHPEDRERVLQAFETVVAGETETAQAVEYRHEQADGTYRWVESVASPEPTPDGYYIVNTRDISESKRRERELEAANERLEAFAGVVSHDIRNPLNVATLRLDLAKETGEEEHLEDVAKAHQRMETLIDELLTLARVGNPVSDLDSVELTAFTVECWNTVPTGDATLQMDGEGTIRADRSRLKQLFGNIVRNSVEHGGDDVTVTVGTPPEPSGFYIADDGPGIGEQAREHVFETGYSTQKDGTGLGLTIASEIAEAHGWDMRIAESDSGGVRVEITGVEFR